jgi:DHA2 family multidrug resistance protein
MATSMSGIAKEKMGNATSIYNLMRNIGGSFGIATMTTFLARRGQVHQNQLIVHITPYDHGTQMSVRGMQAWFMMHGSNSVDALKKSLGAIYGMVQQQAALLSFVEAFWIMGVIFFCMLPLVLLLRNARDLHPHEPKSKATSNGQPAAAQAESEPEMIGAFH